MATNFHSTSRPDLNAKAQQYLKKLEASEKHPKARAHHVNRNVMAQKDLKKLVSHRSK